MAGRNRLVKHLTVTLFDPFGAELGRGVVTINDKSWHDMDAEIKEQQLAVMTTQSNSEMLYECDALYIQRGHIPFTIMLEDSDGR